MIAGVGGNIGQTNYSASKAGIVGMTRTWAKEFGRSGINVNAVAPGFIETDMIDTIPPKILEQIRMMTSSPRLGTPSDVAHAYLFLASDRIRLCERYCFRSRWGYVEITVDSPF